MSSSGNFDNSNRSNDIYFAAKPAEDTAGILLNRGETFFNLLRSNQYLDKLQRMWRAYHGEFGSYRGGSHVTGFTGEQGELVSLPVNHFRNLAQHIYVMITTNRPIMEARAVNTDYKSLAQTYLANGILDYYMREKRLEDCLKKACETSIVLGAGFIKMEWNATAGDAYDVDPDTEQTIYEGEIEFTNLNPLDVIVDGTKDSWNNDWVMVRSFKNRFDLIAKYPEMADKIRSLGAKNKYNVYRIAVFSNDETDDIPVYEFYHKRTESMPDGRYLLFLDSTCVLLDTPMPYRVLPVFRISPGDIMGTPYGYTPMFDIFPLQECINSLYSSIMTNQNAFAVQNVFIKNGNNLNISAIEGGMNILEGDEPPIPINLTQTPKEVFEFLNMLIQSAETLSGVNSVARGNPEASLKSGTALALVQSMALQFISGLQQSYVKLIEDVGTSLIQMLKDFATTPKTIALVGKNNRTYLKEFTGEAISSINRVVVDVGNPLSRTIAGRTQMAEQMMQMKLINTPEEYFQVINTGRIDSMFEGEMNELLNIRKENEMLMEGKNPLVAPTDKHSLHIIEHKAVLSDPDLRENPELVKLAVQHISDHLNSLRTTDPALLQIVGEQPLPPLQTPPGSVPSGPAVNQVPAEAASGPNAAILAAPQPPSQPGQSIQGPGQAPPVNLPNLPKVNSQLLPNPGLQEQAMNNVR